MAKKVIVWSSTGNWVGRGNPSAVGGMSRPGGTAVIGSGPRGGFAAGAGAGQGRIGVGAGGFRSGGMSAPAGGG